MSPVKRYMNAIEWKLKLPFRVKVRVMNDLATSITARHEAGESYEAIMADLGTPGEVAARLNAEMAEYAVDRGSPWRFFFLALAVLAGAWTVLQCLPWLFAARPGGVGVIGGADGPTAIFISAGVPRPWVSAACGLAVTLLAAAAFRRLRKKGGSRP